MARTFCPHPRGMVVVLLATALAVPGTSLVAHASGPGSGETASFLSGGPGPDLFSDRDVDEAVRRCSGKDLLLRDTVSGGGMSLGPADGPGRMVPLPGDEPGRYELECSDGYLVELETPPLAAQDLAAQAEAPAGLRAIQAEQTDALAAIGSLAPGAEVVGRFETLFNGLHIRMTPAAADGLRTQGFDVWENGEVRATLRESVPLINADDVWNQGSMVEGAPGVSGPTGRGSSIAVVDTGIDYGHPDLGSGCFEVPPRTFKESPCKVAGGYDVVNGDPDPVDDHGHGTHVAAIAAGNGILKGVAPDAKLYAYKVLNRWGSGTFDQVIEGLERAVDPNGDGRFSDAADVINVSLGGYGNPDHPLSRAVDNAVRAGTAVAAAAGNASYGVADEENISTPGTSLGAITVGASTKADEMTSFSSRGPVLWDGRAVVKPDLVAPGQEICAARHGTAWAGRTCLDQLHVSLSGTSMATPHVAGLVALLEEAAPGLTPAQVKSVLKGSAVPLSVNQSVVAQGAGRVDALRAVGATDDPPVALLAPIPQTGSTRAISGTVGGDVGEWRLDYAPFPGSDAVERDWVELVRSGTPPTGEVLHDLAIKGLPDGRYVVRLTVADVRGRLAVDHGYVEVEKVRLARPLELDVLRGGDVVDVEAEVDPAVTGAEFVLEHAAGSNPSPWTTVARGPDPRLAWDTTGLPSGDHTLRLSVHHDGIVDREQVVVRLDPKLAPGWPVRVPVASECAPLSPPCPIMTGWVDPVSEDLDGDGARELLFLRFATVPELRAYRGNGTLAWKAPVGQVAGGGGGFTGLDYLHLPLVADIDHDGEKEILVFNTVDSTLYVFAANGDVEQAWPVPMPPESILHLPRMALADVNADGTDEVVLSLNVYQHSKGDRPKILVISTADGAKLAEWFVTTAPITRWYFIGSDYNYAPAVGNLDVDPELEIVTVERITSAIRAFEWNGAELGIGQGQQNPLQGVTGGIDPPGWPVEGGSGQEYFPVTIGDLDGDGDNEVVAGLYGGSALTRIWALDGQGRTLPGWPATFTDRLSSAGASLADLDGDRDLEIVVPMSAQVRALHHDGRLVNGWPVPTLGDVKYPAAVGDIDGDAAPDVVAQARSAPWGSVMAWSAQGTRLSGLGMPLERSGKAPMLVTEMGGRVALVATSDSDFYYSSKGTMVPKGRISIHLWQLPAAYDGQAMPWPTYQHDVTRTGSAA